MAKSKVPSYSRTNCNRCRGITVHDVLACDEDDLVDAVDPHDPKFEVVGVQLRMIVQCQGCGTKAFEHYVDDFRSGDRSTNYPALEVRATPDWYLHALVNTEFDVLETYHEVRAALNCSSYRLAAMGVRATLEAIMIHKIGDQGSFQKHVQMFQDAGFISLRDAVAVKAVLEVGHAAIHRGHAPTKDDVMRMLDILEHVMKGVFANDSLVAKIRPVPPKSRGPK
jgi:hypothetical protein